MIQKINCLNCVNSVMVKDGAYCTELPEMGLVPKTRRWFGNHFKNTLVVIKSIAHWTQYQNLFRFKYSFQTLDTDSKFQIILKEQKKPRLVLLGRTVFKMLKSKFLKNQINKQIDLMKLFLFSLSFTITIFEIRSLSYEGRLNALGLTTLELRRKRMDLIQTYKIINGMDEVGITGVKLKSGQTLR